MKNIKLIKDVFKYAIKTHLKFIVKKPEWYVLSLCFICIAYELKSLNLFFLDLLLMGIIMNKTIS
ncbi:MAG: hypothetical protein EGR78_09585 [Erysipelotrichaceae bacterium]|nr:hypothetical protein [Erysipelotrichaceae bacterium]